MHSNKFATVKKQGSVLVSVMIMGMTALAMAFFIFTAELQSSRNNESLLNFMQEDAMFQSSEHFLISSIVRDAERHCEAASEENINEYLNQLKSGLMKECEGFKLSYDGEAREFTIESESENEMVTVSVYVMKCENEKIRMFRKGMYRKRIN